MGSKFFAAVLTAAISAFVGGWLIFGVAFADFYAENTQAVAKSLMKKPADLWAMAIGNAAWALLITWVLRKTKNGTMISGFLTSLWISFLIILAFDLSIYAFWNIYEIDFIIIDVVISSLFWGVIGGIAGAVLGSGMKTFELHRI